MPHFVMVDKREGKTKSIKIETRKLEKKKARLSLTRWAELDDRLSEKVCGIIKTKKNCGNRNGQIDKKSRKKIRDCQDERNRPRLIKDKMRMSRNIQTEENRGEWKGLNC